VRYNQFLTRLHELLEPPTYLEIGIRHGKSLTLARCPSVGIDPDFELRAEPPAETSLFRETSDEYFDRPDPLAPLGGRPPALSFIDGMHLVEFALRDFINVERNSDWTGVVIIDDVLPKDAVMAARNATTRIWSGDVYKIIAILARHRPDLIRVPVDTQPGGFLLVLGLDPASEVLDDRFDEIVLGAVRPDPQRVPAAVTERRGAVDPRSVLEAPFWSLLKDMRERGVPRRAGLRDLRRAVRRDLGISVRRPIAGALGR
jgi:hypothetical protein